MKYTKAKWTGVFTPIAYPVGEFPQAVRFFGKHMAPYVDQIVRESLEKDKRPVIVCRGSSGAMLSAGVAMFMEEPIRIVHMKKEGESSHSGQIVLCPVNNSIIIVDDFISSGETMVALAEDIRRAYCYSALSSQTAKVRALLLMQYIAQPGREKEVIERRIDPLSKHMKIEEFINLNEC